MLLIERSRKKRKTNTPCKATPVRSNTIRATKINSDDEDDDYKLPEVTLPDTPLRESPGLGTGLSKEKVSNGYTPGNGKKLSSKDGYTGNRSTDRQTVSDQVVDKQSASLKITPIITGKKLSRKKATTTDELGKGSEKKKAKSETQAPKRTLVAGDSGRKRPHPLDRENEVTSTKGGELLGASGRDLLMEYQHISAMLAIWSVHMLYALHIILSRCYYGNQRAFTAYLHQ